MGEKPKGKKGKTTAKNTKSLHPLAYEIIGLLLIAFAIIEVFEYGIVGRIFHSIAIFFFGNLHFVVPLLAIITSDMLMVKRHGIAFKQRVVYGVLCIVASLSIFSHSMLFQELAETNAIYSDSVLKETWRILISSDGIANRSNGLGGGFVGAILFSLLHILLESSGAKVVAFVLFAIGIILITGKALIPFLFEKAPKIKEAISKKRRGKQSNRRKTKSSNEEAATEVNNQAVAETVTFMNQTEDEYIEQTPVIQHFTQNVTKAPEQTTTEIIDVGQLIDDEINLAAQDSINQTKTYVLPSISLLNEPAEHDQSGEYKLIKANAKKLEQTLLNFGVKVKVIQVHLGPTVTKYEIMPDIGVKVSKIVNLQDDLALALAAKDIRMEAPIPGKSAIGIEVPNNEIATVSLREVLQAEENNRPDKKLLIGFGRDVTGKAILHELNKMPHLLVAGSTGSGKSVCINGIIISIIMRAAPHEVKMMMIDPKMVELNVYNGIPHLLAPVVTDPRKAAQALQKVVAEMERRYDLFSHTGTRNIEGYNEHVTMFNDENEEKHPHLPYIVVIVDELADLMMVASNEVEDAITRLAQMARAAGIHLIIATQRPSVDVITGIIKANIPSRIAFAVSSAIDSRTILDMGGAERLLGRGDMLFLPAGESKPVRVQGAFVSDAEVERIVDFCIEQQKAQYEESMIPTDEPEAKNQLEATDELYDDAVALVLEQRTASVSMLQRKFRIGYSRAARIVDQMEARGVVGPSEGSKPRQVLLSRAEVDRY